MLRIRRRLALFIAGPVLFAATIQSQGDDRAPEDPPANHFKSIHALEAEAYRDVVVRSEVSPRRPIPLSPAAAPNLTRTVFGFYPYWAPGFSQIRFEDLTHLAVFSVEADGGGRLVNLRGWPNVPLIEAAHKGNVRVVLVCTLFNATQLQDLLGSATARRTLVANLRDQILSGGADGVNIDFEGVPASQRNNLVLFMKDLAGDVRGAVPGAHVSIDTPAVDWSNAFDYAALADTCDALMIMAYDYHWSGSSYPGPVSPLNGSEFWGKYSVSWTLSDYLTKVDAKLSKKLLLGVPYYGYDWPAESDVLKARALGRASGKIFSVADRDATTYGRKWDSLSSVPWYTYRDQNQHQVWFEDPNSLSLKYDLVLLNDLQGVGIWALTYDRDRSELWELIEDRFAPALIPEAPDITAPSVFFDTVGLPIAIREKGKVPAIDFEVSVGTLPGGRDISDFKPVGLRRQILIRGLGLRSGTTYYVTVRALGKEGTQSPPSASAAVLIDTSYSPTRKFVPHWVSSQELYTGLAIANPSEDPKAVLVRGHVKGQATAIESSYVLGPREQLARLLSEEDLLGKEIQGKEGWVEVSYLGDWPQLMYLVGDTRAARSLDGSPLLEPSLKQVIPELDGGRAWVDLLNPGNEVARAQIKLRQADGSIIVKEISLSGGELISQKVGEWFPDIKAPAVSNAVQPEAATRASYISVESDKAVVCSSTLQRDQDSAVIPALHLQRAMTSGALAYVLMGGGYRTQVVFVNPSDETQVVECRLKGSDATGYEGAHNLPVPIAMEVPPLSSLNADLAALFGLLPGSSFQNGFVQMSVTRGSGVLGTSWILSTDHKVMTALPLQSLTSTTFVFPQLAQAQGYWTGISLANPETSRCDVTVAAINTVGDALGTYDVQLAPGEMRTGLIYQWVTSTLGLSSGRLDVRSKTPIVATVIFGSDRMSFMASVPSQ